MGFSRIFYGGGDPLPSFVDSGDPTATTYCLLSVFSGLLLLHQTGAGCVVVIWPQLFSNQFVKEREFGFGGGEGDETSCRDDNPSPLVH